MMDEVKDRVEYVAEHNTQGQDEEDAHRAFVKFRQTLQASTEEAVATINVWLKKPENRYKETELAELLSTTNEGMVKALELDDRELRDCKYYPYDMAHFC